MKTNNKDKIIFLNPSSDDAKKSRKIVDLIMKMSKSRPLLDFKNFSKEDFIDDLKEISSYIKPDKFGKASSKT